MAGFAILGTTEPDFYRGSATGIPRNEMVTHPKAKFAYTGFCTEVNLNLTAHTKLDRKLFQGRAENFNITYRAFSHDVMSDILMA